MKRLTLTRVADSLKSPITPIPGQIGLFGDEDDPLPDTPEEPTDSTTDPERTAQ